MNEENNSVMLSRRGIFAGVGAVGAMLLLGGAGKAFAGDGDLLRPPGGQDDEAFAARCIKCDRCWSICPLGCITRADLSDGIVNARTPILNFHKGYCDFCNKCIEVCPTGALNVFDSMTDKIGLATINTETCISYLYNSCDKCIVACAFEALELNENGHPVVNENICNGCGECVYACDVNVYHSYTGTAKRAIEVERIMA